MKMKMTESQRILFSEILILNLEFSLEKDSIRKWEVLKRLRSKKISLRRSMGVKEYEKFIEAGRVKLGIQKQIK
jgi:hypothetical protein